jgi:hypothetical protein
MKIIKMLLITLMLILGYQQAEAQSYKFLATGFSVLEKKPRGGWGDWSDLQKTSLVITLDTSKDRIIVYSQEIQLYQIVEYHEKEENENDLIYPFTCRDDDGQIFSIQIITRKKQGNRKQLYINQSEVILVYNIENFPGGEDHKQ